MSACGQRKATDRTLLELGGEQARGLLRRREPALDCGLGIERPEVVTGQEDAAAPSRQGRLERTPPREAVRRTGLPALNLRLDDRAAEAAAQDLVQVVG